MERKYPWYELVDDCPIMQGDFLWSCPIFSLLPGYYEKIREKDAAPLIEVIEYDVVVMSQSCDLVQRKIDLVLVCPVWALDEFESRNDFFRSRNGKEALRQGNVPGYHLLNKLEINGHKKGYMVVDFRSVCSLPFNLIEEIAEKQGKKIRLLPPYREHLSQAFARFFMRVGLPVDIPAFK